MTRVYVLIVAAVLVAVAGGCSGGENGANGDTSEDVAETTTTTPTEAESGDEEPAESGDSGGLASGTGTVTIGDTTWEIVGDTQCLNFGSALGIQGHAVGDQSVVVSLDANTDDPSAASARVEVGGGALWVAGSDYVSSGATIPETTTSDGHGTGTATFVNVSSMSDPAASTYETAQGSYEFNCSE